MTAAGGVVVVDASLAAKWVVAEADTEQADALASAWAAQGVRVIAPNWFPCEVSNILHQRVLRQEITLAEARQAFAEVLATVTIAEDDPALALRALELASELGQQHTYDCQYLALAEREDCACWTADARFVRALAGRHPRVRALSSYQPATGES